MFVFEDSAEYHSDTIGFGLNVHRLIVAIVDHGPLLPFLAFLCVWIIQINQKEIGRQSDGHLGRPMAIYSQMLTLKLEVFLENRRKAVSFQHCRLLDQLFVIVWQLLQIK